MSSLSIIASNYPMFPLYFAFIFPPFVFYTLICMYIFNSIIISAVLMFNKVFLRLKEILSLTALLCFLYYLANLVGSIILLLIDSIFHEPLNYGAIWSDWLTICVICAVIALVGRLIYFFSKKMLNEYDIDKKKVKPIAIIITIFASSCFFSIPLIYLHF